MLTSAKFTHAYEGMIKMKSIKILPIAVAIFATSSVYAQTTSETKTPPPYGDNPNIFKVLAHKTGEKVQNTAERVGAATERGIEKIKPKVDNTWEEAKTYTEQQTERAKVGLQKGADKVVETASNTRDVIVGTNKGSVPIERGSLSQPAPVATVLPTPTTPVPNNPTVQATTLPAPTNTTANVIDPTQQNVAEPEEPEISLKSLPLPQATKDATNPPTAAKEDIPQ